jgi:anti-sigma factor RsiW
MKERCRISRYLTAYADNELSDRLRTKVERHLTTCPACASELDSIRASDRILRRAVPPPVSDDRWALFRRDLSQALDEIDREARRPTRIREIRPLYGTARRWTLATAGVFVALVLTVLTLGPAGFLPWWNGVGNECIVESIETHSAGYTPMFFTSQDPEMTVIWVFAEEVEGGMGGERPSAR